MLRALALRDFVIVEAIDLELATGFTALTGETGAGKSILVDALALVLGARADPGVIRPGAERADLTAEFDVGGLEPARRWLAANELEEGEDDICLVRRTIDRAGRSRGFVNGRPATASQLRELGEHLVDIHGQHEHQWLSQRDYQRRLLDAFGGSEADAGEVSRLHGLWRRAAQARAARERAEASSLREREFLRNEIRDAEALAFTPESWAAENAEHRRLAHAQELIGHCRAALKRSMKPSPAPPRSSQRPPRALPRLRGSIRPWRRRSAISRAPPRTLPRPRTSCDATCRASSRTRRDSMRSTAGLAPCTTRRGA